MNSQNNAPAGGPKANPNRNTRAPGSNFRNNRRRYRGNQNKNRPASNQGPQTPQLTTERLVEKYINLLDQHLVARRKYHDLFYRAEGSQKAKLERNFFNTINDLREFENKIAPEAKEAFEKRINGLKLDNTYSLNHEIDPGLVSTAVVDENQIADPHYLNSQKNTDYANDTEESVGSLEDYNSYKNI